jgi:quercetin dioxygenase-like cupin family protein
MALSTLEAQMARYAYPHTIDNGGGERLTFLRRVQGPNGERIEVENFVSPGAGPPMHTHRYQTEALTVTRGRIGYQRPGQPPQYAGPRETVTFGPGDAHKFWNAGQDELHCVGYVEPPDNIEYFLAELFASTKRNGGKRPDPFDAAYLVSHFSSEFSLQEVPAAVQRIVFPIQIVLGRLLGKYKRYADAPDPVRR